MQTCLEQLNFHSVLILSAFLSIHWRFLALEFTYFFKLDEFISVEISVYNFE